MRPFCDIDGKGKEDVDGNGGDELRKPRVLLRAQLSLKVMTLT